MIWNGTYVRPSPRPRTTCHSPTPWRSRSSSVSGTNDASAGRWLPRLQPPSSYCWGPSPCPAPSRQADPSLRPPARNLRRRRIHRRFLVLRRHRCSRQLRRRESPCRFLAAAAADGARRRCPDHRSSRVLCALCVRHAAERRNPDRRPSLRLVEQVQSRLPRHGRGCRHACGPRGDTGAGS